MRISDWSSDVCSSDLRASTGAFYTAFLETEKRNRDLIDSIIKAPVKEGSDEARIANFYKAYIDTQAIDAAGMKPVQADRARFDAVTDKAGRSKVLGEQVRADGDQLKPTDYSPIKLSRIIVTQGSETRGAGRPSKFQCGSGP